MDEDNFRMMQVLLLNQIAIMKAIRAQGSWTMPGTRTDAKYTQTGPMLDEHISVSESLIEDVG